MCSLQQNEHLKYPVSRFNVGPTQPSVQWVSGSLSRGVKQQENEAANSPLSCARLSGAIPSLFRTPSWRAQG